MNLESEEKIIKEQSNKPRVMLSAQDEAYIKALNTFNVDNVKTFLKTWDRKSYKIYSKVPYKYQKKAMCEAVIKAEKYVDDEVVEKAKKYISEFIDK